MNAWDVATWIAAFALAGSAIGIFVFFIRDAGSILNREMQKTDEAGPEKSEPGRSDDESASTP